MSGKRAFKDLPRGQAGSTTRLRNKEICHERQDLIICGPKGFLNGFVILNTMLNLALSRLSSNVKAYCMRPKWCLLKVEITANIASL